MDKHVHQPLGCNSPDPVLIIPWEKAGRTLRKFPCKPLSTDRSRGGLYLEGPTIRGLQYTSLEVLEAPKEGGTLGESIGGSRGTMLLGVGRLGRQATVVSSGASKAFPITRGMTKKSKSSGPWKFGWGKEDLVPERRPAIFPAQGPSRGLLEGLPTLAFPLSTLRF